ncbi:MAG: hypothetical protein L6Q49_22620, partial [Anaerolineales bacterium]|nr:hypothetical protein [Anaerolineales bacterium]
MSKRILVTNDDGVLAFADERLDPRNRPYYWIGGDAPAPQRVKKWRQGFKVLPSRTSVTLHGFSF